MVLLITLLTLWISPAHSSPLEEARISVAQSVTKYGEGSFCGGEGARCTTNLDCCRGSCWRFVCRSGPIYPPCRGNGSACERGSDCCSGMCLGRRCQPRVEP